MYNVMFRYMSVLSLRDKITLGYSLLLPLILMIGLGMFMRQESQHQLIVSGIITISTLFWGMQGIAFQIHAQRSKGVYKLLKITPLPMIKFVAIMVLARSTIGVVISMFIWLCGVVYYRLELSPAAACLTLAYIILSSLCFTSIGFVIGNLSRNEGQINMLSNALQIPMILMSESFYSLAAAPEWIAAVGRMLPFEHIVKLLSSVYPDGRAFAIVHLIIPIGYILIAIGAAVLSFRTEEGGRLKVKTAKI